MTFTCDVTLAITETVPLTNVTLDGNGHTVVLDGGGSDRILSVSGPEPVSVIGLTFSNGSASGVGGGAITVDTTGNLTVTDSTFRNNSAIGVLGGAILNDGTLVVRGSTFENNEAGAGGAISNYGIGSPVSPILTVEASTFSDNYANSGGAIDSASGTVNITGSTFDSNSGGNGGGAFSAKNTTTTVTNSTFVSNTGSFGAVFFLHSGGDIAVTNSTLLNNWATTGGSAVYAKAGAAVTVTNSILAQPDFGAENCLIYTDDDASLTNGGGNFATDRSCDTPITGADDLHLASLANNGGPTETVALLPGSVAIGAANHDVCMAAPVGGIDQRGNARGPYICDSGAYDTGSQEHDVTPPIITYTMTGERGSNAWWKSDVTLTWSVVEPQSPDTLVITDCVDQHITSDQTLVYYSCAASSLGGTASIVTVYIRRDATPPVVTVNGVQDGATYVEGSVPATSCTTTDQWPEFGISRRCLSAARRRARSQLPAQVAQISLAIPPQLPSPTR